MQTQVGLEHTWLVPVDDHRQPWLNIGNDNADTVSVVVWACLNNAQKNASASRQIAAYTAMKPGIDIRALARTKDAGYSGQVMVTAKADKVFASSIELVKT